MYCSYQKFFSTSFRSSFLVYLPPIKFNLELNQNPFCMKFNWIFLWSLQDVKIIRAIFRNVDQRSLRYFVLWSIGWSPSSAFSFFMSPPWTWRNCARWIGTGKVEEHTKRNPEGLKDCRNPSVHLPFRWKELQFPLSYWIWNFTDGNPQALSGCNGTTGSLSPSTREVQFPTWPLMLAQLPAYFQANFKL